MGQEAIKEVAKEVLSEVGKGRIPKVGKIMRKKGYSEAYSKSPNRIKKKKAYQEEIEPVIQKLVDERNKVIESMRVRNIDEVAYDKLASVLDTLTKNIELLSGRPTNREDLQFYDEEQAEAIAQRIINRKRATRESGA